MPPPMYLPSAMQPPPMTGLASPGLVRPEQQPGPETQTFMASPLADRMGGVVQAQQQQNKMAQVAELVRMGLRLLSSSKMMTDPKGAAKLEKLSADLLTMFTKAGVPQSAAGMQAMASQMPMPSTPQQAFPPAPVAGTNRMPPMGGSMMPGMMGM